jgi:hypothetical protein
VSLQVNYLIRYTLQCDGTLHGQRCPCSVCGEPADDCDPGTAIDSAKRKATETGMVQFSDGRWICDANLHDDD